MSTGTRLQTLPEIEAAIWAELARAAADRQHAWHTPVLATVDGTQPDARTVVLREVDPGSRRLAIYSDSRAAKRAQLEANPQAVLVLWSPALAWQLRVRLTVRAETDGIAVTSRWARLKLAPSSKDYLSALAPGAPLQRPGAALPAGPRAYFALLDARVDSVDWLELSPDGHRRAVFDPAGARWLQP